MLGGNRLTASSHCGLQATMLKRKQTSTLPAGEPRIWIHTLCLTGANIVIQWCTQKIIRKFSVQYLCAVLEPAGEPLQ